MKTGFHFAHRALLARHYRFPAELDFVLNCDIKYRLGRSEVEDEEYHNQEKGASV
jgi:hypothetical protein